MSDNEMPQIRPRVFISYAQYELFHSARVLDLANALVTDGVDVELDQFHHDEPINWARWCEERLRSEYSDFVLMVCSAEYRRRIEGKVDFDKGRGVFWEGNLIYSELYCQKANERFIPLLLDDEPEESLPRIIKYWTWFRLHGLGLKSSDPGYESLYRLLTRQPAILRPSQGQLVRLLPRAVPITDQIKDTVLSSRDSNTCGQSRPIPAPLPRINHFELPKSGLDFLGRTTELLALDTAWSDSSISIVTIVAPAGVGKTALIKEWLGQLTQDAWRGADQVYVWSSVTEGSSNDKGLEDVFFDKAMQWFEIDCNSSFNVSKKGQMLADVISGTRTLLILDGLETLQYPPGKHIEQLRAPGIRALLSRLALQDNPGLCIVTSRKGINDLDEYQRNANYPNRKVLPINLKNLDASTGAQLLHRLGVIRAGADTITPNDPELIDASAEVKGHALSLNLLGRYLKKAEHGDVRCRDKINLADADAAVNDSYALMVISAYEKWFEDTSASAEQHSLELDILRLFGFFDRPVSIDSLNALRAKPPIHGLTSEIVDCKTYRWNIAIENLIESGLLWFSEDRKALDTHHIVRDYFADQLCKKNSRAWIYGHKLLYKHFKNLAAKYPTDLQGLLPLYEAVAHACHAGNFGDAYTDVYLKRIQRGDEFFSTRKLGAISSDLRAVGYFFTEKWNTVVETLPLSTQGRLLNDAAFSLRALGRTDEALEPFEIAHDILFGLSLWKEAAAVANNLSEIMLVLGKLEDARNFSDEAVKAAQRTNDQREVHRRCIARAYVCHQIGAYRKADGQFEQVERFIKKHKDFQLQPFLSFLYWDYQLAISEILAWRFFIAHNSSHTKESKEDYEVKKSLQYCSSIGQAADQLFNRSDSDLLGQALNQLVQGRAGLYRLILEPTGADDEASRCYVSRSLEAAVEILKQSAQQDEIPRGLLPYAWLRFIEGNEAEAASALDDALRIAKRGNMKLHMADTYLHRARLFRSLEDLVMAEELIEECGYRRRCRELEDAKVIILNW